MDVCKARYYEKKGKSVFFIGKIAFFQKFVFSAFTQLLQKRSCKLYNNCLNLFLSLRNCSLMYTQYYERKQAKVIEKIAFFSKIPINFRIDNEMKLYIAQKISRNNMGGYKLFTEVFDFSILHRTRKEGQKKISTGKKTLFQKIVFSTASQLLPGKVGENRFFSTRKMIFLSKSFLWPLMFKKWFFSFAQ